MASYLGFSVVNPYQSRSLRFYDPVRGHTGVDLAAPFNSPLTFPVPFTVLAIRRQEEMGLVLYAEDAEGHVLVFAHLESTAVQEGQRVEPETVFARSGNSGTATTGAHLHFEIIAQTPEEGSEHMVRNELVYKGYNIDPIRYLDGLTTLPPDPHWSKEAMKWAQRTGILELQRNPLESVTWGEFIEVLYKYDQSKGTVDSSHRAE